MTMSPYRNVSPDKPARTQTCRGNHVYTSDIHGQHNTQRTIPNSFMKIQKCPFDTHTEHVHSHRHRHSVTFHTISYHMYAHMHTSTYTNANAEGETHMPANE